MILHLNPPADLALLEPWDFKRFKLQAPIALAEGGLATALGDLGKPAGGDAVWISAAALRQMGPGTSDQAWQVQLEAMIEKAAKFGWVDATSGAVRAHVEWV